MGWPAPPASSHLFALHENNVTEQMMGWVLRTGSAQDLPIVAEQVRAGATLRYPWLGRTAQPPLISAGVAPQDIYRRGVEAIPKAQRV